MICIVLGGSWTDEYSVDQAGNDGRNHLEEIAYQRCVLADGDSTLPAAY